MNSRRVGSSELSRRCCIEWGGLLNEEELACAEQRMGNRFDVARPMQRAGNRARFFDGRDTPQDREVDRAQSTRIARLAFQRFVKGRSTLNHRVEERAVEHYQCLRNG